MKIVAVVLISAVGILLTTIWDQKPESDPKQRKDNTEISLSIHFQDGLSGSSNDQLPDIGVQNDGCHLSLLLTNKTHETLTLWKPYCPQGDRAIRLEFKKTADAKTIGAARTCHDYTGSMGVPKTFTLLPDDSLVYCFDFSSYWSLPFVLNNGEVTTVFVRAVYESEKASGDPDFLPKNSDDVWVDEIATKWQQVRLTNVSGKRIATINETNILE
jgi:hypothetical protein